MTMPACGAFSFNCSRLVFALVTCVSQAYDRVFRAYFLASAHHPVWPGDFSLIPRWVAGQQYDEPLAVLRGLEG